MARAFLPEVFGTYKQYQVANDKKTQKKRGPISLPDIPPVAREYRIDTYRYAPLSPRRSYYYFYIVDRYHAADLEHI